MTPTTAAVIDNREFVRQLNGRAARDRVPLAGSLELTRRCPLRCVHCYLPRGVATRQPELTTAEVCRILDEIAAAGCLNLLLTGGEPLLRDDFPEVYRHARELGLLVTVFTSATRVDDAVLGVFRTHPPRGVEVTVHGATATTFDAVTGVPGSHRACVAGIERLRGAGVRVSLKTVLLERNRHELGAIEAWAHELGAAFRFDAAVFPRLDRDVAPLAERVAPATVVDLDLAAADRRASWMGQLERVASPGDRLYTCGAARTGFHVNAHGWLQPCVVLDAPGHDLRTGAFADGWDGPLATLLDVPAPAGFACQSCAARPVCDACPALHRLESGTEHEPSRYLCDLGQRRHDELQRSNERQRHVAESGAR